MAPRVSGPAAGSIATGVRRTFIDLMPNCLKMISSRVRPIGVEQRLGVGLKLGSMLDVSLAGPRMAIRSGPIHHSFVVASVGFPCLLIRIAGEESPLEDERRGFPQVAVLQRGHGPR